MKTFIRAQLAPWRSAVEIFIGDRDGKTRVKEIVIERMDEAVASPPSFMLDNLTAQTLMDDLWHCGIRPADGAGTAGAMRAVERHLEDMRTLVFKTNAREEREKVYKGVVGIGGAADE